MMCSSTRLWLSVFLCVGCGSVSNGQLADAPAPDTVTRGTVHVTVLDPGGTGAPAVGANVVFVDPDGTLVKRVATDSAGKADADVLPGASVTSIALINTTYQIQTILVVQPGDNLVLGTKSGDFTTTGMFTVSYPAAAGAVGYQIANPCGVTFVSSPAGAPPATTATFTINNSCKQDMMEIVVTPTDASGLPTSSISKTGVPFVAGGSTTITGSYQSLRNFTGSYTNINPIVSSLQMSRAVPDAFGISTSQSVADPTASSAVTVSGVSAGTAVVLTTFLTATRLLQVNRQNLAGGASTYGLDVGSKLLPWINMATYDAAARKLVVPLDTTGTSNDKPDLFRISATYRRTDVNNVTTSFVWTLFGPEARDLTLPVLPPEVGNVAPVASDTVATTAFMFEADGVTYDNLRSDPNAAFLLYGSSRPPATTVRLSRAPLILR